MHGKFQDALVPMLNIHKVQHSAETRVPCRCKTCVFLHKLLVPKWTSKHAFDTHFFAIQLHGLVFLDIVPKKRELLTYILTLKKNKEKTKQNKKNKKQTIAQKGNAWCQVSK